MSTRRQLPRRGQFLLGMSESACNHVLPSSGKPALNFDEVIIAFVQDIERLVKPKGDQKYSLAMKSRGIFLLSAVNS